MCVRERTKGGKVTAGGEEGRELERAEKKRRVDEESEQKEEEG